MPPPVEPTVANPAMLVLARESRGWRQRDLAGAVNVTQPTLSKYESGALGVPDGELGSIADALEFSKCFFYQSDPVHAVGASLLYRHRASTPVRVQRRVEAAINIRKMQITRLLRSVTLDSDHTFPSIPPDTFDGNVGEVAREVRRVWRVPRGPIANLTRLIESCGGIVVHMDFGTHLIDGASLWVAGLPPLFFMRSNASGERYRFSLAHELGHIVMHRASASGEVEDEANRFASEFLMPERDVRQDVRDIDLEKARRIKAIWKVSMQALIERSYALGGIAFDRRRRLFTQLSARGARIEEPWPIPLEGTRAFDQLLDVHRTQLGWSDTEIGDRILFTEHLNAIPPKDKQSVQLRLSGQGSLFMTASSLDDSAAAAPQSLPLRLCDAVES